MKPPVSIETLMEMWSTDARIDESEPAKELARIPILHAKYLNILTYHNLIVKKIMSDYVSLKKIKYEYYKGDFSQEDYQETGWEIFVKHPGRDINLYMESDKDLNRILLKKISNEEIVSYCTTVLKELNSRTFQLRSFIDWQKYIGNK